MADPNLSVLSASDLPITLYLNQRFTFDILASLRGGFSSFTTVQTVSDSATETSATGGASLGVKNVFGLFSVDLSGQGSRATSAEDKETTTETLVHTPASLFSQLRRDLKDRELVQELLPSSKVQEFEPSSFIELSATLRRNPLNDILDTFSEMLPILAMADAASSPSLQTNRKDNKSRGRKSPSKPNRSNEFEEKFEKLKSIATSEGSEDLIAEVGGLKLVLTIERNCFMDPSMNDVIDGTFRVFGKVTRVVNDETESISLFRKSALGKFGKGEDILGEATDEIKDTGFKNTVDAEVFGPTIQVIPIAIFS